MEIEVSREAVWKVTHTANHHLHETIDAGAYPFSWQLQVLINAWDAFGGTKGTSWTEKAQELETDESIVNTQMAEIEGTTKLPIDDDLVKRVEEIAAAERTTHSVEEGSFEENLQVVLEAWNEFYGKKGVGWRQ